MADFGALTKKLVANAILNQIPGLNSTVTYKSFVSDGTFDPVTESRSPVFTTIDNLVCVGVRPTYNEVTQMDLVAADMKLLIPGTSIPEPQEGADKVILKGEEWWVRKYVGVPGGSLWSVYISRT